MNGMIVPVMVWQHAEDATLLANTRANFALAPHVKLNHLRRLDDRLGQSMGSGLNTVLLS